MCGFLLAHGGDDKDVKSTFGKALVWFCSVDAQMKPWKDYVLWWVSKVDANVH